MDIYRTSVDWTRLAPRAPSLSASCRARCAAATMEQRGAGLADCVCSGVQNASALARYGEVLRMVRTRGMRVMLTLFHHSLPPWAIERGGWKDDASLPEE